MISKKSYFVKFFIVSSLLTIFQSCVTLNSHQSGRTLGKGNRVITGSYNFGKIDTKEHQFFSDNDSILNNFHIIDVQYRQGLTKNVDIGFSFNSTSHLTVLGKYQFIGNRESLFASSIGLSLGLNSISLGAPALIYNNTYSLFNSLHPNEKLAVYLNYQYHNIGTTSLLLEGGSESADVASKSNVNGLSTGIIYGKKNKISLELSLLSNDSNFSLDVEPIVSIGYIFYLYGE